MTQTTTEKQYRTLNGTYYDITTCDEVVNVLERCRQDRTRIHFRYGETSPESPRLGLDWLDEFDCKGYVGRSTGEIKIPLLIKNKTSIGGGGILDHCIIRIATSVGDRVLYQHPKYHQGYIKLEPIHEESSPGVVLRARLTRDGVEVGKFWFDSDAVDFIKKIGLKINENLC